MPPPQIAITMGDPAGVGPELCLRLLAAKEIHEICTPVIFGDAQVLRECAAATGLPTPKCVIAEAQWVSEKDTLCEPAVLDLAAFDRVGFQPGVISAATGAAAFHYVEKSIDAALSRDVAAVTTAPLNKEAMHAAGIRFPGHTEIFAERTHASRACMFQYSEEVRASFVTVHLGITRCRVCSRSSAFSTSSS
jgi:4-hydroxythreonine-4-phosphate dehydrogenase